MTSITATAARLICDFDGAALPAEALRAGAIAIRDCIGVALAGCDEPVSRIVRETTLAEGGPQEASIWGAGGKTSALDAALVNGTAAHALDYDDQNRSMLGHPTAVLAPALFALAEMHGLSGRRVLEGYVLGLQVMAHIGRRFGQRGYDRSWHPTAAFGVLGSCAASAYLNRLDYEATLNALGIAASEASSVKKNFGSMVKPLHVGSASRKGLWAARLAQQGLTANAQALDGRFGYFDFLDGAPHALEHEHDWAQPLEILETGLVYKQYPCCGGLHALLDAAIDLRKRQPLAPQAVEIIECRVNPNKLTYLDRPQPSDPLDAKFSVQYCVACALADGGVGFAHFEPVSLLRPDVRALMSKIRLTGDASRSSFGCVVTVVTREGARYESACEMARGSPDAPLTESELAGKFIDCASARLGEPHARSLSDTLLGLADVPDVRPLAARLSPAP